MTVQTTRPVSMAWLRERVGELAREVGADVRFVGAPNMLVVEGNPEDLELLAGRMRGTLLEGAPR